MKNAAKPNPHLATLDLLRVVAALAVVLFHYIFRGPTGDITPEKMAAPGPNLAIYGYLGVNLFFLISGFVIAWSAEGRNWTDFTMARIARLYPGFLVCMSTTFLVLLLVADTRFPVSITQFAANLFMFSPALRQPFMDGVYWSIVLEVIFYGWVAVALMLGIFDRWRLELIAGWLLICVLNQLWLGSSALRIVFVTEFGALFCAGMLIQYIHRYGRSAEALGLLAAAFAISTASMIGMHNWMTEHYGVAVPMARLAIANVAIFALMLAAIRFGNLLRSSTLILALGGMTYPLYLLHQNIGYLAIEKLAPFTGSFAAMASVTFLMIAASLAVWAYLEPHGQSWIRSRLKTLRGLVSKSATNTSILPR